MNLILINDKKRIKHEVITDIEFDNEIYDNSGIKDPGIAGFVMYFIEDNCLRLNQIFVRPEARGKGLGLALLKDLDKLTKKHKKEKVVIINGADENDPVYKLFIKSGLKRDGKLWEKKI